MMILWCRPQQVVMRSEGGKECVDLSCSIWMCEGRNSDDRSMALGPQETLCGGWSSHPFQMRKQA